MSTIADFYIEKNNELRYLGSQKPDGNSLSMVRRLDALDMSPRDIMDKTNFFLEYMLRFSTREDEFLLYLDKYLSSPYIGGYKGDWPWEHEDSSETDFVYVFCTSDNKLYINTHPSDGLYQEKEGFIQFSDLNKKNPTIKYFKMPLMR